MKKRTSTAKDSYIRIRTSKDLKMQIKEAAAVSDITMSGIIEMLINDYLKQRYLNHG